MNQFFLILITLFLVTACGVKKNVSPLYGYPVNTKTDLPAPTDTPKPGSHS